MSSLPRGSNAPKAAIPESVTATVESLSHDGRGVARVDGKAVFVPGALPGEIVRLAIRQNRRRYAMAQLIEVIEPAPARVVPPCRYFGVCGGCSMQHLNSDAQLEAKREVLAQQFMRLGNVAPEAWLPPLAGPSFGYRRRARFSVRFVPKKGGALVGFREARKSFVTPLDACLTVTPGVSALLPGLKTLIESLSRPDRIPQIEVTAAENATALVLRHLTPLDEADHERLRSFAKEHAIELWLDAGEGATPFWPETPAPLYYTLPDFGLKFEFEPTDFIQINADVNRGMVGQTLAMLEVSANDRVLDLFCGLGNFTLPLARSATEVLGIEADSNAVERARHNARLNGISNVEFRAGNLYDETGVNPPWHGFAFNKLLLDPPRSGALEAIKRLGDPLPSKIVYVSCYPATLSRDADYLVHQLGYRFAKAGVMDMFPQTGHIEAMAVFTR